MWLFQVALLVIAVAISSVKLQNQENRIQYPQIWQDPNAQKTYSGITLADPFKWLELVKSKETAHFVKQQANLYNSYMQDVPFRKEIESYTKAAWHAPTQYLIDPATPSFFVFFKTAEAQKQKVLYIQETLDSEPVVFFDPNPLSKDGSIGIGKYWFTDDGKLFVYTLTDGTTVNLKIREVATGKDYPETLTKISSNTSIVASSESNWVIYVGIPDVNGKPGTQAKVLMHIIGTQQSEDTILVEFPKAPKNTLNFDLTVDNLSLVVYSGGIDTPGYQTYLYDLSNKDEKTGHLLPIPITKDEKSIVKYVANKERLFVFISNRNAHNYEVITIDLSSKKAVWSTLIGESEIARLEAAKVVNVDYVALFYFCDSVSIVELHDINTGELVYEFPVGIGSVTAFYGHYNKALMFVEIQTFLERGTHYYIDLSQQPFIPVLYYANSMPDYDPSQYVTELVTFTSRDGTEVPMYIVYSADTQMDNSSFGTLVSYQTDPDYPFRVEYYVRRYMCFKHLKAVYAVPLLRGGTERVEAWHQAGMKNNKQNAIDDFIAAADFLIQQGYVSPHRLYTVGNDENGGVVVAASANQRPDLFGLVSLDFSLTDMMGYHLYQQNSKWVAEYGTSDDPKVVQALLSYSPYQNVLIQDDPNIAYPGAIIQFSSANDATVFPAHQFKFTAAVQTVYGSREGQTKPLLMTANADITGSADEGLSEVIKEFLFIVKALDLQVYP